MDLSPKQRKSIFEATARLNIWEGAVRSGKSHSVLLAFINELQTGPDGAYTICGRSERTVKHNIIDPLQAITGGAIRYKQGVAEFTMFGKKVYVVGANDERAESKIRGATFAGALIDEATILPQSFFKMLLSRLSVKGAKAFISTNPDSPYHWFKTEYIDNASLDKKIFKFRLEDNPSLDPTFVENLKKEYQGLWYKRYIEGLWVLAEGTIYDFFDTSHHVVDHPPTYAKHYFLGVDYGTHNPFAAVLVGYNDDRRPYLWVEKEYYYDPKVIGHQQTDSEFADDILRVFDGYPIRHIYLDPSAESFEVELKRRHKPVIQANNDVLPGIRTTAKLFSTGDLVVTSACRNLIKEIEGYVWDPKCLKEGLDKPLKRNDHLCDALRYVLNTKFGKRHSLKEDTREDLYKQEQQRKYQGNPMQYPGFTDSFGWQKF